MVWLVLLLPGVPVIKRNISASALVRHELQALKAR